ncbi:Panacea domain-containing protein [Chelatococcus daeguensis]|uniref:Panacea domain-containing protein n=1 Tax=Chelatococcus daeguensis TaxID=444444 RepID=UPI0011AE2425|nr:Panacea domain-containing protein [Chelatococcus daeguensis]
MNHNCHRQGTQSRLWVYGLELQKILYLAHMFYLGRTGGEPLVPGHFEAWDYGPVHPDLYHKAKIFGADPVENIFHGVADLGAGPEREILDEAYEKLGKAGPGRLVSATHRPGGAWDTNYVPGVRHIIISNDDILNEYRKLNNGSR